MSPDGAEQAVTSSAMIVAAVYAFRKLIEPAVPAATTTSGKAASLVGLGPPPPFSRFVVGWGVTYTVLAAITAGSPDVGGPLAILVAVGTILGNGTALSSDVNARLSAKTTSSSSSGPLQLAPLSATEAGI